MKHLSTISRLREALCGPLPGLAVQMGMAPMPRPGTERILDPYLDCRRAGVLVLFYPCDAELSLVLTRRTDEVYSHRGQISFPGGSMDPEEDAATTALREAYEELGVDPGRVEVLGELSPLYIPPSGFCVYPVVAYTAGRPEFVPNAAEVAEVLEVSLTHLLDPTTRGEEVWPIRGADVRVPFYRVGRHKVWGATAMMLCELLMLLQPIGADPEVKEGVLARGGAAAYDPRD